MNASELVASYDRATLLAVLAWLEAEERRPPPYDGWSVLQDRRITETRSPADDLRLALALAPVATSGYEALPGGSTCPECQGTKGS